jgi:DNA primase
MSSNIAEALFAVAPQLRDSVVRGSNYILVQCPFHGGGNERTPSCSVSLEKPVFFCHSCMTSGHISQVFRQFGLGKASIDVVLADVGMDHAYRGKTAAGKVAMRLTAGHNAFRGRYVLDEDLLDAYRQAPTALLRAGFEKATLRHFEVGYDVTNMRITFPIRNVYGDLVGISGRAILDELTPRYKIYSQELIDRGFQVPADYSMEEMKDAVLWHAHVVRPFLYKADDEALVITEGFKTCMWTWQSGYQSTVALVGAYLTDMHVELITTAVRYVVLFLDNNEAGWKGTLRAGRILSKKGIYVKVAVYPDGREQADALTSDEVKLAIRNSESFFNWSKKHDRLIHEAPQRWRFGWDSPRRSGS